VSREIRITVGEVEAAARLNDTNTAEKVLGILPFASAVSVWGDEVYFDVPVDTGLENGKDLVELGDIAYWPQGKALCIFFGRTPIGEGDEIRPISEVTVVGRVVADRETFRRLLGGLKQGEKITLTP
jgi:hypothetical protein